MNKAKPGKSTRLEMRYIPPAVCVCVCVGDHGSNLQECDDQSGRDEQIPEDALCAGLQLQNGADLQGLRHTFV